MMTKTLTYRIWLGANLIGLICFFYMGRNLWIKPEDNGLGGPGDGLYFMFFLVPLLAFYCLMNLTALLAFCLAWKAVDFKRAMGYWGLMTILWFMDIGLFLYNIQGRTGS
jgi:hypothetical protein